MSWTRRAGGICKARVSVFVVFTLYPDMALKEASKVCKEGRDISGLVRVSNMSSANSDSSYSLCRITTPRMSRCRRMASARGSRHKIKSNVEIGHPCRVPLVIGKRCDRKEDIYTWAVTCECKASNALKKGPCHESQMSTGWRTCTSNFTCQMLFGNLDLKQWLSGRTCSGGL